MYCPNWIWAYKSRTTKRTKFPIILKMKLSQKKCCFPQICRFSQSATSSRETLGWHRSSHKTGVAAPKQFLPTDPTFTAAAAAVTFCWSLLLMLLLMLMQISLHCYLLLVLMLLSLLLLLVLMLLPLMLCCCHCFWCFWCCSVNGNFNSFRPSLDGNLGTELTASIGVWHNIRSCQRWWNKTFDVTEKNCSYPLDYFGLPIFCNSLVFREGSGNQDKFQRSFQSPPFEAEKPF